MKKVSSTPFFGKSTYKEKFIDFEKKGKESMIWPIPSEAFDKIQTIPMKTVYG